MQETTRARNAAEKICEYVEGHAGLAQVSPPLRDLGTEAKLRTNPSFNAWTTVESVVRWGSLSKR